MAKGQRFTSEFKHEAVRLIREADKSVSELHGNWESPAQPVI